MYIITSISCAPLLSTPSYAYAFNWLHEILPEMAQSKGGDEQEAVIREVLRANCDDVPSHMEVASPLSLGQKFVAAGIVTDAAFREMRHLPSPRLALELFICAKTVLEYDSSKFYKFLSILFSYEPCMKVTWKICEAMKESKRSIMSWYL